MSRARIAYTAHPGATPESELSVLAAVYAFILKAHAQKIVTKQSGQEDTQGDKEQSLQPVVAQEKTF